MGTRGVGTLTPGGSMHMKLGVDIRKWDSAYSLPIIVQKAERGSGVLSDISCHMGLGRTS